MSRAPSRGVAGHHHADGDLVVVDGSNIATEGRSTPSLAQLNEAVLSFRQEFPDVNVTVVVDATFGHRISKSEVAEFDEAVAHNELVAPPAGAVGRGDAFVLSIANKSGARILSNDSFQEFHGTYPWLFDEGRLVGGKPVPYVGWVFVNRVPVKGAVSRKVRASSADKAPARRPVSKLASQAMPVPSVPPPGPARATKPKGTIKASEDATAVPAALPDKRTSQRGGPVNELLPFLDFIQHHPIGSSVSGVVESYSSHGAYVTIGDVRGYVPLRLMGNPPPRSAREVMKQGEAVTLVVDSFAPSRRSIDLALPGLVAPVADVPSEQPAPAPTRKRGAKAVTDSVRPAKQAAPAKKAAVKKTAAKKSTAKAGPSKKTAPAVRNAPEPAAAPSKAPSKKSPAKKAPAKTATTKTAASSAAAAPPPEPVVDATTRRTRSGRTRKQVTITS
jgi:S1 RNA binding domain/Zc3h12a-like Ribonuclease NYN domain